jgi:hypothetical protein
MVSHSLNVPETLFQRARRSERRRSRDSASELHRLDRAAHGVGHRELKVRPLLQRVGLPIEASPPRFAQGVEQQQAAGAQDRFCSAQLDLRHGAFL